MGPSSAHACQTVGYQPSRSFSPLKPQRQNTADFLDTPLAGFELRYETLADGIAKLSTQTDLSFATAFPLEDRVPDSNAENPTTQCYIGLVSAAVGRVGFFG